MDFDLIVYALNLASIYALMAIGISILWSSVGIINMAHGATFAVSGYAALIVTETKVLSKKTSSHYLRTSPKNVKLAALMCERSADLFQGCELS